MSYYVYNPKESYADYLRDGKFIRIDGVKSPHILLRVPEEILSLITDKHSLSMLDIRLEAPTDADKKGFAILSYTPKESNDEYPEMMPTYHWGVADRMINMGHMNEKLNILVQKNDSPEQTLAFNHFAKAKEAFERKDYPLALLEIDKAVYGDQVSSGFRTEWRFFYLQGIIHLGFYGCDYASVNLKQAEEAFVNSALFARAEFPSNSALSYVAASWTAYCQGNFQKALTYAEKATECYVKLTETHYLLAKYYLAQGKTTEGFVFLSNAIEFDAFYALKAASDGDVLAYEKELKEFLVNIKHAQFERIKARIYSDMGLERTQPIPENLMFIFAKLTDDNSMLEINKAEREWNEYKMKAVFTSKAIENLHIEHEALVKVVEPYREKVIIKPATWYRKEESKLISKKRIVERLKKVKYDVKIMRDSFKFFTGKTLAEYDMILVEGSKFNMGDTLAVGRIDENPVHEVVLSSFLMCKTEITQKIWNLAMDFNPSNFHGYDLPVEHVSWYDCLEFCNNLSVMAGFQPCYRIDKGQPDPKNLNKTDNVKWTIECDWDANGYRLPTEAEWEFAAKGGINSNFYRFAGSERDDMVAWYKNNSGFKTQNVAQKRPNELGLYDMSGNVWEWCWDWYDPYGDEACINPQGPAGGSYKVIRGGSWADSLNYQRTAGRGKENPTGRYTSIGVRIVRKYVKT